MNTSKCLVLSLSVFWLSAIGGASADDEAAAGNDRSKPMCILENRLGERKEIVVPGEFTIGAEEIPLRVRCDAPTETTLNLSANSWLPVTMMVDGLVVASLEPAERDRNGKLVRVTASFNSANFQSPDELNNWFKHRVSRIDRGYSARLIALEQSGTPCKFNAACYDEDELLDAQKKAALHDLSRIRAPIQKRLAVGPKATPPIAADTGSIRCVVDKRRGKRSEMVVPARLPVYWREMPLSIECGSSARPAIEQTLRMPRDRWLPVTTIINDIVMASLDPKAGYRFRKPARITLTLYPRAFASIQDRDRWYNARKAKIEQSYKARQIAIEQAGTNCRFDASCHDDLEELEEKKKAWLRELANLRAATTIRPPGTARKKPASVTIKDGGKKICLTKVADGSWKTRPCEQKNVAPKIRRITVNGKEECIVKVNPTTWESHPCP